MIVNLPSPLLAGLEVDPAFPLSRGLGNLWVFSTPWVSANMAIAAVGGKRSQHGPGELVNFGYNGWLNQSPSGHPYRSLDFSVHSQAHIPTTDTGLSGTGARTVAYAFRSTDTAAGIHCVVCAGLSTTPNGKLLIFSLENGVMWGRFDSNTTNGGSGFNDDEWHVAVWTFPASTTASGVRLWVDDVEISLTPSGSDTLNTGVDPITFGKRSDIDSDYYDGQISMAAYWNRVLSDFEIRAISREIRSGYPNWLNWRRLRSGRVSWDPQVLITAAQTLPVIGQAGTISATAGADVTQTLPSPTEQAGTVEARASIAAAQTLPAIGQAATATNDIQGDATQTLPTIGQAATATVAGVTNNASAAQSLPTIGQAATATATAGIAAAQTLPSPSQAGTIAGPMGSEIAQILPTIGQAGAIAVGMQADSAQTLPAIGQAGSIGTEFIRAADIVQALPAIGQAGSIAIEIKWTAAQQLPISSQAGVINNPVEILTVDRIGFADAKQRLGVADAAQRLGIADNEQILGFVNPD